MPVGKTTATYDIKVDRRLYGNWWSTASPAKVLLYIFTQKHRHKQTAFDDIVTISVVYRAV